MVSFLKLSDLVSELSVREVLERAQASIDGTDCSLLGIAHSNKKADLAAIERILGPVAFTNFVRSVMLTTPDDAEEGTYRLVHGKHNLSQRAADMILRPVHIGEDQRDQYVRLSWSHPVDGNTDADAVFDRKKSAEKPLSAGEWLSRFLKGRGEVLKEDVIIAAAQADFKAKTVEKAITRHPDRFVYRQEGFPARSWWSVR
jgi:hypothetical protein